MPSVYLKPSDFAAYGLPPAGAVAAVQQASAVVDQALGRPEGLVWLPDATGMPAYMAALTATQTFALVSAIQPGSGVNVQVSPPILTPDLVGEVLILDRGTQAACEAVVVTAVVGRDTLILGTVRFAHAQAALAEQGLVLAEERSLPAKRNVTRVSRLPVANLLSAQGRYGYGRRSDQTAGLYTDLNLLAAVQAFGGPPLWLPIDITATSASPVTGEVWVPSGILLATYSDVRLRYVAGWSAGNLPGPIKQATANIASTVLATADIPGQLKSIRAGDHQIQRFAASNLDPDTKALLEPFKARVFF